MTKMMTNIIFISSCFIHLVSSYQNENLYANPNSLERIAERISRMFKDLERSETNPQPISYFNKLGQSMEETVKELKLFHVPPIDPVYSKKAFVHKDPESQIVLESFIDDVFETMNYIDSKFNSYKSSVQKLKSLVEIHDETDKFLHKVFPTFDKLNINETLLDDVAKNIMWFRPKWCIDQTPVPRQYSIFTVALSFVSARLKGFFIFVVNQQHQYGALNISIYELDERIQAELLIIKRALKINHPLIRQALAKTDEKMMNCGMEKLRRDVNFIELERVFQLIAIPQHDSEDTYPCNGTCADMHGGTSSISKCYGGFCGYCEGVIRNCQTEVYIHVCKTVGIPWRRYQWMTNKTLDQMNGTELKQCDGTHAEAAMSYNEYESNTCEYCICTCEENTEYSTMSTFIISSQFVEADVNQHKVITGLRFVKQENIIYIQIKQGQLTAGGHIRHDIIDSWKPITYLNRKEVIEKLRKSRASKINITNENFIVISNDVKFINLNDLGCGRKDHVVTGVKLGLSKIEVETKRIVLSIGCHRVSFKRGELTSTKSSGPLEHPHPTWMKELSIGGLPPNKVEKEHFPDSSTDQFVEIKMSDYLEDAGQSVLPWFDSQDVMGTKSVALAGIGLYHRGAPKSGGFIAFRLWTIDYTSFIFPEDLYADLRLVYETRRPWLYCAAEIPHTLCILCNGSYAERNRRGIIDECCSPKLCDASYLKQYCGPIVDDVSDLYCAW